MQKTCKSCGQGFRITERDQKFFENMGVLEPTLCPEDASRTRLSFRNETDLYKRTCAKSGKNIITYHPPHAPYPVFDREVWWSDQWDPLEFGKEFDFNRSFLEQVSELNNVVPKSSIYVVESENCEYTNFATHNKNCYLIFGSWFNQDCMYGNSFYHSTSCLDCHYTGKSQFSYECIDCRECYECAFCQDSESCANSKYLYDCRQCEHCIGCWNLRRKKYHIWNKEVPKEEYEKIAQSLKESPAEAQKFLQKFRDHVKNDAIHKSMTGEKNENASGDFIYESKNIVESYNVRKAEDIYYSDRTEDQKDQYYCTGVHNGERAYNSLSVDFSHTVVCGMNGEQHTNSAYCVDCYNVEECIGCVGLRQKKHCILNKQYTREEYEELAPKIREYAIKAGEWGEFFPLSMNPFFFNKTVGYDYFPLSKEEATKVGLKWKEDEDEIPDVEKIIPAERLPEKIEDIPDDVLNWAIKCETTKRPYLIMKQEIAFYRKFKLPIPHFHPEERSRMRLALRKPRKLWNRKCKKCETEILSAYSPERPEKVYCEPCYLKEVY